MIKPTFNISDVLYIRRPLRVLYGQTQAYPFDAQLDPNFSRTGGAIDGTATTGITGSKSAILPGLVAVKQAGDRVTPAYTFSDSPRAFGLFANYVGGTISDFPADFDRVGVWRGVGSVYELLAPVFNTANSLSTVAAAETTGGDASEEVYMNPNAAAQLQTAGAAAYALVNTARLLNYLSANAIEVELLV